MTQTVNLNRDCLLFSPQKCLLVIISLHPVCQHTTHEKYAQCSTYLLNARLYTLPNGLKLFVSQSVKKKTHHRLLQGRTFERICPDTMQSNYYSWKKNVRRRAAKSLAAAQPITIHGDPNDLIWPTCLI